MQVQVELLCVIWCLILLEEYFMKLTYHLVLYAPLGLHSFLPFALSPEVL